MPFLILADAVSQLPPDPTSLTFWITQFGPTGVILFFIGGCLWRLVTFMKPWVIKFAEAHFAFVNKLGDIQVEQNQKLSVIQKVQAEHGERISDIHAKVRNWHRPEVISGP